MTTKTITRGWGWPINARFQHYFSEGPSVCGAWDTCRGTITRERVTGPRPCVLCEIIVTRLELS